MSFQTIQKIPDFARALWRSHGDMMRLNNPVAGYRRLEVMCGELQRIRDERRMPAIPFYVHIVEYGPPEVSECLASDMCGELPDHVLMFLAAKMASRGRSRFVEICAPRLIDGHQTTEMACMILVLYRACILAGGQAPVTIRKLIGPASWRKLDRTPIDQVKLECRCCELKYLDAYKDYLRASQVKLIHD